ncbi:MAG TPA: DUF4062 domain-containing protein [Candidatus Dormibacteraeota bacterium]|nr:DUF4062 domain-containing protein [Candidatus Dormibacteraeota bacterium]
MTTSLWSQSPVSRLRDSGPWRVFMSHTADLRQHPADRSFIDAAEAAVIRAGHAVTDMAYFGARDVRRADYCRAMVERADVYVGVIGARYGVPVTGRPELSYTELEFETATAAALPRLVFLVRDGAPSLPALSQPEAHRSRQRAFRRRLRAADVLIRHVTSPADLELELLHALCELRVASAGCG